VINDEQKERKSEREREREREREGKKISLIKRFEYIIKKKEEIASIAKVYA
jgi:hypothetical protein